MSSNSDDPVNASANDAFDEELIHKRGGRQLQREDSVDSAR